MAECTHDCETCGQECSHRGSPESMLEEANPLSQIDKVYAVVSGKGGVGKSLVTSMLAVLSKRMGFGTALFDADITGPSIPKSFGVSGKVLGGDDGMIPVKSAKGIEIMSLNLLVQNATDPVIWRGPVIAGVVKQFWTDVIWENVDYMFIDMPPGTGDVPLTVFQSIPINGIIVVTTPQDLVSMIVAKAVNMAKMMNIPIVGLVENMAYYKCPDCGSVHEIFGASKAAETAKALGIDNYASLPIDPELSKLCDRGLIELFENTGLDDFADKLLK